MKSDNRPVLIYDGDCDLCRRWIARWSHVTEARIDIISSQEAAHLFPEISPEQFQSSVQLVQPDGVVYEGAEAVFRTLAFNSSHRWPLWLYRNVYGVASATEFIYRFIARHRGSISRVMRRFW
jgi:predicted DCC family thiol-disulfide oxidoreductase YuxK